MQEFLFVGGWFDHYQKRLGLRYLTFKMALNILLTQNGRTIVETGTMRAPDNWLGDGGSTYIFGEFATRYDLHFWTCDLDPAVMDIAKNATAAFSSHTTYVVGDSVAFLSDVAEPIDLLYLDSHDCPVTGDASAAQRHNLNELIAAYPRLSNRAIVLLDDNFNPNGGKTKLTKEYLLDLGWICLFDLAQSLWLRPYPEITFVR
jgi:hypothetical protein